MRVVGETLRLVAAVYFAVTILLLIWGVWLLATPDPDGGRRPVGGVMLVVAVVCAAAGAVALWRSHRRAR